jgi:hypothetical protein
MVHCSTVQRRRAVNISFNALAQSLFATYEKKWHWGGVVDIPVEVSLLYGLLKPLSCPV